MEPSKPSSLEVYHHEGMVCSCYSTTMVRPRTTPCAVKLYSNHQPVLFLTNALAQKQTEINQLTADKTLALNNVQNLQEQIEQFQFENDHLKSTVSELTDKCQIFDKEHQTVIFELEKQVRVLTDQLHKQTIAHATIIESQDDQDIDDYIESVISDSSADSHASCSTVLPLDATTPPSVDPIPPSVDLIPTISVHNTIPVSENASTAKPHKSRNSNRPRKNRHSSTTSKSTQNSRFSYPDSVRYSSSPQTRQPFSYFKPSETKARFKATDETKSANQTRYHDQYGWFSHAKPGPKKQSPKQTSHPRHTFIPPKFSSIPLFQKPKPVWKQPKNVSQNSTQTKSFKYSFSDLFALAPRHVRPYVQKMNDFVPKPPTAFKSPLIPRNLFQKQTPSFYSRRNSTSLHQIDTAYKCFSKVSHNVGPILKWVPNVVLK